MFAKSIFSIKQQALSKFKLFNQKLQLPEKWKGGRIEKWSIFWQSLFLDYRTVAEDTIKSVKTKPVKALFITSGLGLMIAAMQNNPDEAAFYDQLIQSTNTLVMVGEPIKNPLSDNYVRYLTKSSNQELLRRTDLIFFSIMWMADYNNDCKIYFAQCKYLKPQYATFHKRIIDVGLFGTWLNLKLKMKDYDINPKEWDETN